MPKRSCPHCDRRLPYAGRRCIHCGWSVRQGTGPASSGGRRSGAWVLLLVLLTAYVAHAAYRNADMLADWYAGFAARHLPDSASSFGPTHSDAGAFFYCARQVARRMDGEYSVETFPSQQQSRTIHLARGRYQIESFVDEAREDGRQVRHSFVCRVHFERGRWVLEDLRLTPARLAASPARR